MKKSEKKVPIRSANPPATALAWYTREEWDAVRREASDPEVFDATYETWQANATRTLDRLRDQGLPVERVFIRASDLRAWCDHLGIPQDSRARSRYAAETLRTLHHQNPHGTA